MEDHTNIVHLEHTKKFDVIAIELTFSQILDEDLLEKRTLLSKVLPKILTKFPSKIQTRAYFADLYATKVGCFTNKLGAMHAVTLQFLFADPDAIKDPNYTMVDIMECVEEVVLHPFIQNDGFDADVVEIERTILIEKIKQIYDDKTTYAQVQLVKNMYKDTVYGLSSYGKIDNYTQINEHDLFQTYQQMLLENTVNITAIGNIDVAAWNTWSELLITQMQQKNEHKKIEPITLTFAQTIQHLQEAQQINQTKLHMGYHVPTDITKTDYLQNRLAIEVLGGGTQSKLFMNVREKASLAYYAAAVLDPYAQGMFIYAGVEFSKLQQAEKIIDEQLQALQKGEFTEVDLEMAKMQMLHRLSMSQDTPWGMMALQKQIKKMDGITNIAEWEAVITTITHADVVAVSNTWQKTTVFTLIPNDGGKLNE